MAVIANETGGHTDPPVVGDRNLSGGPSVGPMQVYRSTALALDLWEPSDAAAGDDAAEAAEYAALAFDERRCVSMGVEVFAQKVKEAGGDWSLALQRYNGSGPSAREYQARALAFMASREWDVTSGAGA